MSSFERKRDGGNAGLVAFLTQPQDPANLGIFRVFFGNYQHSYIPVCLIYTNLPSSKQPT
jgi:hypothetical protein